MQIRQIPGFELPVSLLGFGNFIFGTNWWGEFSDAEGIALQNRAVELGVTFFDTAPGYGNGRAEHLLAQTIRDVGRDRLVISTKFGYDVKRDPGEEGGHRERQQNFSPAAIREELDESLARLGVDCIDLYQAHNLKLPQFDDEMFDTLDRLREQGKIRAWGVALGPAIGWAEEGRRAFEQHDAATVQTVLNLYEQDPGRPLCEQCAQRGRGGVIARVPTNSGILDEEFASPDHRFPDWDHRKFRDRNWLVYGLKKNDILRPIAGDLDMSIRELAIRWLASQPGLVSIEPNITTQADLEAYAHACDGKALPADVLGRLDALYAVDFELGAEAHPCDLKSSVDKGGVARSAYQPAPVH